MRVLLLTLMIISTPSFAYQMAQGRLLSASDVTFVSVKNGCTIDRRMILGFTRKVLSDCFAIVMNNVRVVNVLGQTSEIGNVLFFPAALDREGTEAVINDLAQVLKGERVEGFEVELSELRYLFANPTQLKRLTGNPNDSTRVVYAGIDILERRNGLTVRRQVGIQ